MSATPGASTKVGTEGWGRQCHRGLLDRFGPANVPGGKGVLRLAPMDASQETVETAAPNAVFSPGDDLATLWFKAYQGEVSGETLFGDHGRAHRRP